MKASYRWLRELLGADIDISAKEVAARLTGAGIEVEGSHAFGVACEKVKVARVVSREPHPARAKLSLVTVDLGGQTQRVVCGAANVPEPGGLVVLAPLHTHLPAVGLTLEPKDIGGVTSEGMLCSETELGLRNAGPEAGILILPPELDGFVGRSLAEAVPATFDTIFEISLTPNRPDGLGHLGLAREIAALLGVRLQRSAPRPSKIDPALTVAQAATIQIEDPERCPVYGAALVKGVKVGPSPLGMQWRLEALGVRAISNVVDITNWVMLLYGHPIHGFDLDPLAGRTVVVRRAKEGEPVETLDGVQRKLVADDLVIADASGVVALAGVMGAQGSGIQDSTRDVLIECAYFTPRGVRRAARRHGMHTESSHRFERGVDPGDVASVLDETASLLCEIAGGSAAPEHVLHGPGVPKTAPVTLRERTLGDLLGVGVPWEKAKKVLADLGCSVASEGPGSITVIPPSHRPDLGIEVDLVEEVIRVHGIDSIPAVLPAIRPEPPRSQTEVERGVLRAAMEVGLSQALTFGFTSPSALAAIGAPEAAFKLINPLTDDRTVMRTSLLPGLFDAVRRARRHGVGNVRLFTTGARFLGSDRPESDPDARLAREAKSFAAVIAGWRDAVLTKPEPIDVYDAKGVALAIVERATRRSADVRRLDELPAHLHPRAAGAVMIAGRDVGTFGMIHPRVERAIELDGPCAIIELDLDALIAIGARVPQYRPIPVLPASTRDIALVVSDDVSAGDIQRTIAEAAGELAERIELFDRYRHESLGKDRTSLAFHVVYRDPKAATDPERARTLTDAEVDARHAAVKKLVEERWGAELRA